MPPHPSPLPGGRGDSRYGARAGPLGERGRGLQDGTDGICIAMSVGERWETMAVEDVVAVLMAYCEDGEETFRDLHGPEAAVAVQDVIDLLEGELSGQLGYD